MSVRSMEPWTAFAWIWTVAVLVACLLPRQHLPVPESHLFFALPHLSLDKVAHFAMFAGFGALWTGWGARRPRAVGVFLVGLVLAVGTELGQGHPLIGRDPSAFDALADVLGLAAGIGVMLRVGSPAPRAEPEAT